MSTPQLTWLVAGRSKGGKGRLLGTAAGITIGVALLLLIIGAYNGLADRTERQTWTHFSTDEQSVPTSVTPLASDEVIAASHSDRFHNDWITEVVIAATPNSTVAIPGVPHAPAPGEFYASPAMVKLVEQYPADELADRYGTLVGMIGQAGIPSPDAMMVISGASTDELDPLIAVHSAYRVTEFQGYPYPSRVYQLIAFIGGLAVLFPVVIFIGIVTRLGQAARSERLSSLRLMGATPQRVAVMSALETGVTALLGALAGILLWRLVIPIAAHISIEGGRFFPSDLNVAPTTVAAIVLGSAVLATIVAYLAALRAGIGPLGGSREIREQRPRARSLIVVALGLALVIGTGIAITRNVYFPNLEYVLIGGFIATAAGLVVAGPWITSKLSGWGANRARSASGVIAMNRIKQHPRSVFRSVSGLVLAVFIVTVFSSAVTTAEPGSVVEAPASERVPTSALVADLDSTLIGTDAAATHAKLAEIRAVPGVTLVTLRSYVEEIGAVLPAADAATLGINVPPITNYVSVSDAYFNNDNYGGTDEVVPVSDADATGPQAHPYGVIVNTDGSPAAIERARTALNKAWFQPYRPPMTRADEATSGQLEWASQYAGLANTGIVLAMLISAVSLAIATIAGVLDRRRVLGLLRLTGMPPSTLRKSLTLETAVPLLGTVLFCIAFGVLTASVLVTGLSGGRRAISWPDGSFYATIGVSLLLAAVAVVATFRTARKSTEIESTRFE